MPDAPDGQIVRVGRCQWSVSARWAVVGDMNDGYASLQPTDGRGGGGRPAAAQSGELDQGVHGELNTYLKVFS